MVQESHHYEVHPSNGHHSQRPESDLGTNRRVAPWCMYMSKTNPYLLHHPDRTPNVEKFNRAAFVPARLLYKRNIIDWLVGSVLYPDPWILPFAGIPAFFTYIFQSAGL